MIELNELQSNPHPYGPPVPIGYRTTMPAGSRHVFDVVKMVFEISEIDLMSHRRDHECLRPRMAYMYLAKKYTRASYVKIGKLVNRDHSTTIQSVRRASVVMSLNDAFAKKVKQAEKIIIGKFSIAGGM